MKHYTRHALVALLIALFCLTSVVCQVYGAETESVVEEMSGPEGEAPAASVEEMMAGLSDEQVRQMLLEELKLEAAKEKIEEAKPQRMKGPAYILSSMLRSMTSEHDENEVQVRLLLTEIPDILPELNQVFLRL